MSGVTVTVDDAEVRATLARLVETVAHPREALDAVGLALVSRIRGTIASGQDYKGVAFMPLSPVTLARRRKQGRGAQILRDTGRLLNSITHHADDTTVEVSADAVYAAAQQFGNPDNRMFGKAPAPIPPRPFFPIDATGNADLPDAWRDETVDIMSRFVDRAVAG